MSRAWKLGVIVMLAASAAAAAAMNQPASAPASQPTSQPAAAGQPQGPKEAAVAMCLCIETNDRKRFDAIVVCKDRDFVLAAFDAMTSMRAFAAAFEKVYGDACAETIRELKGLQMPPSDEVGKKGVVAYAKDNPAEAVVAIPGRGKGMTVRRDDAGWKVDWSSKIPPAEMYDAVMLNFRAMHTACTRIMPKIGQKGLTAEQVVAELDAVYKQAMGMPASQPADAQPK